MQERDFQCNYLERILTDLLVALIHHYKKGMKLFFRTPLSKNKGHNKSSEEVRWWSIGDIVKSQPSLKKWILFAHIWGGCDSTSATHTQGKLKILRYLEIHYLQDLAIRFYKEGAHQDEIGEAGCAIMIQMYGGKQSDDLTTLRHAKWYQNMMVKNE